MSYRGDGLHWRPYRVPLRQSIRVAGQLLTHREGLLIEWCDRGNVWRSDASPLPGVHKETLDDCRAALAENKFFLEDHLGRWREESSAADSRYPMAATLWQEPWACAKRMPSLQFGVEQFWWQFRHGAAVESPKLPSAGLVDLREPETATWPDIVPEVTKVKLGPPTDLARAVFRRLCGRPELRSLRIDFNGNSTPEELATWLEEADKAAMALEYIEEPPVAVWELLRRHSLKLALDESLWAYDPENAPFADVWILKPTRLGGISTLGEWLTIAASRGIRVVLSSCYDTLRTCQTYHEIIRRECLGEFHGLGTLRYWQWDPYE